MQWCHVTGGWQPQQVASRVAMATPPWTPQLPWQVLRVHQSLANLPLPALSTHEATMLPGLKGVAGTAELGRAPKQLLTPTTYI